eukprot:TRINITY_DN13452_c0_g1_i1.p1 TRINITY_DN13452_c0_g1~~TRINITY_DN13452_c0_g1_i1.p1  ORF type:complete len:735 (+),score=262.60 TRINITY_DN13452_c0_g1_i1:84-2207(+)
MTAEDPAAAPAQDAEPGDAVESEEKKDEKGGDDTLHGTSDYSPEVTKLLKGWKEPFFGPGRNKVLEASGLLEQDAGGRKEVTWRQMHEEYGYQKPAHGCRLIGDITQRDNQYWEHQKHVKIRDRDGTEHACFFYLDDPERFKYEELQPGCFMQINSPRLHRFMDGQDGMRLDEEKMIGGFWKSPLTDVKRLDYGEQMKSNGNRKFKEEKYEDAVDYYEAGLKIVTGSSFVDDTSGEQKQEALNLEVQMELNIAQSAIMLKNYDAAIIHGRKALALRPTSSKAYLRMGQAALARGDNTRAVQWLEKALELAPGDPSVAEKLVRQELSRARGEDKAQKKALKGMYSGFLGGKGGEFGAQKGTIALSGGLTELKNLYNFRDVGGRKVSDGRKIRSKVLYRSSAPAAAGGDDVEVLRAEYGIKTVVDLRTDAQRRAAPKRRSAAYHRVFQPVQVTFGSDGKPQQRVVPLAKGVSDAPTPSLDAALKGRVELQVDVIGTLFWEMLSFWLKVWCVILLLLFQRERATRVTMQNSLGQLGQVGLLQKVLDERGDEIRYVLESIADTNNHPVVVSCSEGKDLTALICILVLGCLGASDQEIEEDYLASDRGIGDQRRKALYRKLDAQGLDPGMALVTRRTLRDVLEFIREREWGDEGGGFDAYFDFIGFSKEARERLRAALLPPLREREDATAVRKMTDQEALRRRRVQDNFRPY